MFQVMSQHCQMWTRRVEPLRRVREPVTSKLGPTKQRQQSDVDMLLAHRIRLDPTPAQRDYLMRAAGTARRVWNWALAEWLRQFANGQRPNAMALKKQFNAIKYSHQNWLDADGKPWLRSVHRDAHSQPFANLAKAWSSYFAALREHRPAHRPVFKKKGRCRDSFYIAACAASPIFNISPPPMSATEYTFPSWEGQAPFPCLT